MHITVHIWGSQDNFGWSLLSSLFETDLATANTMLARPWAFRDAPVSASLLAVEVLKSQV